MYFKRPLYQFTDLDVSRNNFPILSFSQSSYDCSPLTQDLVFRSFLSFISVKIDPLLKVAYVLGKEIKNIYQGRRPSRSNNKREIKRLCKVACKNSFSVHRHG